MKKLRRLALIGGMSLTTLGVTPGCRKSTVVKEVSVGDTGVSVVTQDRSALEIQWPQWRGPRGDGIANDQPLPTQWDESTHVQWRSPVPGRGHSSPIVIGDLVVVGTAIEKEEKQLVIAYDSDSGQQRWQQVIHQGSFPTRQEVHRKATNANSTLASDGKVLVTTHLNNERIIVTALGIDGEELWQTDVGAFASRFGYAPSPVFYQSLVIVVADNDGGGYLVGLDAASGDIAWRRKRGDFNSYSSPRIATVDGVDQLLITGGGQMTSYDPATGQPRWETPCIAAATCGTVVTTSNHVLASGGFPDNETVCLSATGEKIWSDRTRVYEPSMITDGENLYAISDDGIASCWSVQDGSRNWKKRLGGKFSSSPVMCNGLIYVADLSGKCYVFRASADEFDLVATNQLGDDSYASPAIADGSLFLRVGIGEAESRTEQLVRLSDESTGDGNVNP